MKHALGMDIAGIQTTLLNCKMTLIFRTALAVKRCIQVILFVMPEEIFSKCATCVCHEQAFPARIVILIIICVWFWLMGLNVPIAQMWYEILEHLFIIRLLYVYIWTPCGSYFVFL